MENQVQNMSIEDLRAEVARLKALNASSVSLKIGQKGTVCLYGIGRRPAAYYASQWETILSQADNIKRFIEENKSKLAWKQ